MKMKFTTDDRGVSEVIGAILVFGLMIALMAVLQTQAIPAANEEVEFNHNQDVQSDLVEFQAIASRTAASGSMESVKIQMGTTYPSRLLFFNPRNPSGNIQTVEDGTVEINNIRASDTTVRKHIDGDLTGLETKRIVYRPQYNEFSDSPTTVLEYGTLYNDFGDNRLIQDEGNVVNGNHIDLMFFTGELSRTTGGAMSINSRPASAPARTVTVEPVSGSDVRIEIPTGLTANDWSDILSNEIQNGNVNTINPVPGEDRVEIVLDGSVSHYTLRLPVIGVGSNVEQPDPVYVIGANGHTGTVPKGSVREVSFEVRDKYNNPVQDEELNIWLDSSAAGSLDGSQTATVQTDDEGQATVRYEAPTPSNTPLTEDIYASLVHNQGSTSFSAGTNPEDYIFEMTVVDREIPTGPGVSAEIDITDTNCADTDSGLIGTTLLGGEAADITIDWSATTSSPAVVSDVTIKMIDDDNGQIASTTNYSPNSETPGETVVLRDQRQNSDSCAKPYTVKIDARTDGGRTDTDEDSSTVS